jgi:hypothetical protein
LTLSSARVALIAGGSLRHDFVSLPDDNYYHPVRAIVKVPIGRGGFAAPSASRTKILTLIGSATCKL